MIRINLLPKARPDTPHRETAGVQQVIVFLLLALLGLGGVYFVWKNYDDQIAQARQRVNEERRQVARLQKAIKLVNHYKKTMKLLVRKIKVIEKLKRQKTGPVRLLDQLSLLIPKQVWLTSLKHRGRKLRLVGDAKTKSLVAKFMKALEESPYFRTVELKGTHKVNSPVVAGGKSEERFRFTFTCRTKTPS